MNTCSGGKRLQIDEIWNYDFKYSYMILSSQQLMVVRRGGERGSSTGRRRRVRKRYTESEIERVREWGS